MSGLTIRPMTAEERATAALWAAREGWNPGARDIDAFAEVDPEGFLAGVLDGELAATIAAVAFDDAYGFIGYYVVRPDLRGRGHGIALWRAGMHRLDPRNIGLDGGVAQRAAYARSGFLLAYRNLRFVGRGLKPAIAAPDVLPLDAFDRNEVLHFNARHHPAPRAAMMRRWLDLPGRVGFGVRRADRLTGFGCLRPATDGVRVGPLLANDAATAARLFAALVGAADGRPLALDVPEPNGAAIALAEAYGMEVAFETARMYTKGAPPLPLGSIYGLTSFELG